MPTTSRSLRTLLLATGIGLLLPCAAAAQGTTPGAFGFVSTRYSNSASDFILVGYGHSGIFGLVGLAHNPRVGYNELLGGLGMRFSLASWNSHTVAVAYSEATDSPYLQMYLLPSLTFGGTTAEALVQVSAPGSSAGAWKVGIKPVSVSTKVIGPLSLGGSYQLTAQENAPARHLVGPQFRVSIPRGVVMVDLLEGFKRSPDEIRVSFRAGF